jgi:hypothetical protein
MVVINFPVATPLGVCIKGSRARLAKSIRNKKGQLEKPIDPLISMASPRVLPVYPSFYLRLRKHYNFIEFYPSKRHRKPMLLLIKRGSVDTGG